MRIERTIRRSEHLLLFAASSVLAATAACQGQGPGGNANAGSTKQGPTIPKAAIVSATRGDGANFNHLTIRVETQNELTDVDLALYRGWKLPSLVDTDECVTDGASPYEGEKTLSDSGASMTDYHTAEAESAGGYSVQTVPPPPVKLKAQGNEETPQLDRSLIPRGATKIRSREALQEERTKPRNHFSRATVRIFEVVYLNETDGFVVRCIPRAGQEGNDQAMIEPEMVGGRLRWKENHKFSGIDSTKRYLVRVQFNDLPIGAHWRLFEPE